MEEGRRGEGEGGKEEETVCERRRGGKGGHTHIPKGFSEAVVVEEGKGVEGG